MPSTTPTILVTHSDEQTIVHCSGPWIISTLHEIEPQLRSLEPKSELLWEMSNITEIDSSGVALWQMSKTAFDNHGIVSTIHGVSQEQTRLYNLLYPLKQKPTPPPKSHSWIYRLGYESVQHLKGIQNFVTFLGEAFVLFLYTLLHPTKIRYRSIVSHLLQTGVHALPIIAISAFLIGVVIAYQSIVQLQKFGADIFIVDTIGISLTRELAPLITAIVVAGRSGSAFTAQIGAMKMTQEIDAMKTMGFDPFIFLVWPRVIALMIAMPLLIFFADMVGIFGGMVIAQLHSNLSFSEFVHRLQGALALKHYLIGIIKGPFFAFLIAMISTYRGFQVSSNTESIGFYTTKSVVNSIFLVIACDALFSILLTELKL